MGWGGVGGREGRVLCCLSIVSSTQTSESCTNQRGEVG